MLLRQLHYFIAVVETNSFTQAAEQCHISQSAVSQQIQALEHELGVELLHRGNRKFTLTEAGEHLCRRVRPLLAELDRLFRETAELGRLSVPRLRAGCLKSYVGSEFQISVAEFARNHPEVLVEVFSGSHEDLYHELRSGRADILFSDQRRAFSNAYVNRILTTGACCVELSSHSPLAEREGLTAQKLRGMPCILTASPQQRDNEMTYYREIMGLDGEFLFAGDLEQARLLAAGDKGYLPVEATDQSRPVSAPLRRIPLLRGGSPIPRTYCAFWKVDSKNPYVEELARILEAQFP